MDNKTNNTDSAKKAANKERNEVYDKMLVCTKGVTDLRKKEVRGKVDDFREKTLAQSVQKNLQKIGKENFFNFGFLWRIITEVVTGAHELGDFHVIVFNIRKIWGSHLQKFVELARHLRAVYQKLSRDEKKLLEYISIMGDDKLRPTRKNCLKILDLGEMSLEKALIKAEENDGEGIEEIEEFILALEDLKENLRNCNLLERDKPAEQTEEVKEEASAEKKPKAEADTETETNSKSKQKETVPMATESNGESTKPEKDAATVSA